jgi:hypothetical protein
MTQARRLGVHCARPDRHAHRRLRVRPPYESAACANRGWTIDVRELDDSFPEPTPSALEDAEQALAAVAGRDDRRD